MLLDLIAENRPLLEQTLIRAMKNPKLALRLTELAGRLNHEFGPQVDSAPAILQHLLQRALHGSAGERLQALPDRP